MRLRLRMLLLLKGRGILRLGLNVGFLFFTYSVKEAHVTPMYEDEPGPDGRM